MMKTKLGVDMGNSRLYQKPYSDKFYLVSHPTGNFVKFSGDDTRTTWENISHYIAQLEKLISMMLCTFAYFLYLSLELLSLGFLH